MNKQLLKKYISEHYPDKKIVSILPEPIGSYCTSIPNVFIHYQSVSVELTPKDKRKASPEFVHLTFTAENAHPSKVRKSEWTLKNYM